MIYLKRKSMKKYVVVYKRKKYIKVATAIGSKFYRILVVIYLLFSCIAINAKTIRVFTGNIQRVEKTVRIDGNTYFLTLKDGTMYQLEDEKQYSIVLGSWKYFKFIMIDVKDNGKKNDIASFFYYMWNCWDEHECAVAFEKAECGWRHLWNKYREYNSQNGHYGAVEEFLPIWMTGIRTYL